MASVDKIRNILSNSQNFTVVNKIFLDRPSVAVNSIVNTFLPSGTSNSSNEISRISTDSSLASFNFRIILELMLLLFLVLPSRSKFVIIHTSDQKIVHQSVFR